jgi:hypothetical protein
MEKLQNDPKNENEVTEISGLKDRKKNESQMDRKTEKKKKIKRLRAKAASPVPIVGHRKCAIL